MVELSEDKLQTSVTTAVYNVAAFCLFLRMYIIRTSSTEVLLLSETLDYAWILYWIFFLPNNHTNVKDMGVFGQ